jgi:hypothetical protein
LAAQAATAGLGPCRIVWMTRLSCGVPAVIGRWKQRNARRLRSVLWRCATFVPGAEWKRSVPLQTKCAEVRGAGDARLCELVDGGITEGPRERARHHRGLALALSGSQGLRLGPSTAPDVLSHRRSIRPSRTRSRYRDRHANADERVGKYQDAF